MRHLIFLLFISFILQAQNFIQIATIPERAGGPMPILGFDTNHNGREEIVFEAMRNESLHPSIRIYEHIGNNQYQKVYARYRHVLDGGGDADNDGLYEIYGDPINSIALEESNIVYESPHRDSFPTRFVWARQTLKRGSYRRITVYDIDKDSKKELIIRDWYFICIFENNGDNSFREVYRCYGESYWPALGDFDGDKKNEFVTQIGNGQLLVYENIVQGQDTYGLVFCDTLPGWVNNYDVCSANDMDRDGKIEFLAEGDVGQSGNMFEIIAIFEVTGNNEYSIVWKDSMPSSPFYSGCIRCGDIDGDSIDEIILAIDCTGIFVYKCVGPDEYRRIWYRPTTDGIGGIGIHDWNKNGYKEFAVITSASPMRIFEYEGVGISSQPLPEHKPIIFTNPSRPPISISFYLFANDQVTLNIYDSKGALVRSLLNRVQKRSGWHKTFWNGRDDSGNLLPSGIYFLRLEGKRFYQSNRIVFIR